MRLRRQLGGPGPSRQRRGSCRVPGGGGCAQKAPGLGAAETKQRRPLSVGTCRLFMRSAVPVLQTKALCPQAAGASQCVQVGPAAPPAGPLQWSVSPLPPQLRGHLRAGPGLQQLRPPAQPAHERCGRLQGHYTGEWASGQRPRGTSAQGQHPPGPQPPPARGSRCPSTGQRPLAGRWSGLLGPCWATDCAPRAALFLPHFVSGGSCILPRAPPPGVSPPRPRLLAARGWKNPQNRPS